MKQVLLAIDDQALPLRKNIALHLSKPTVRPEPVLLPGAIESNAPDNLAAHFYGTVLHDAGTFRMWYYACHWGKSPDWPPRMMQQIARTPDWAANSAHIFQGPLCYAESDDGINWRKPALNQVRFKGSRANNALALPHTIVSGAIVIKDDSDSDPARRYKMTYQFFPEQTDPPIAEYGTIPSVALATSPDGIGWTVIGIPFRNQFVEPSSFIRHNGQYIIHYQVAGNWAGYAAEGGTPSGRTGVARVTRDFAHWPDLIAEAFALPEPEDHALRGSSGAYDQVHLGVGAASLGDVCVGLYGLWHNADNTAAFDDISCDFGLVVSNDGVHFREPAKGYRFLRRDESQVTPVAGYNFNTILCQANGILNVNDETRIYHGRWRNVGGRNPDILRHYSAEVALATLPRDRWGTLTLMPGADAGTICSRPVMLADNSSITVNATGGAGLLFDLLDTHFVPIPGYANGTIHEHNGFDTPVLWKDKNLSGLAGREVRIQVRLQATHQPRLFALGVDAQ